MNPLCSFMLVFVSDRAPITCLICMISIEKSIYLNHTLRIEVEYMPRDRVYGVKFSGLGLNLIVGFIEPSNASSG